MADKPLTDPLTVWSDLISQWEKNFNTLGNQGMASDQFSSVINQAMSVMLRTQQASSELMTRNLASLNLPSRNDLVSLGEQLGAIETQLGLIANILERQSGGALEQNSPNMPPRTKRPAAGES